MPWKNCFGIIEPRLIRFMDRICLTAETGFPHHYFWKKCAKDVSESVAHAACVLAEHLDAKVIVSRTYSGAMRRSIFVFCREQSSFHLFAGSKNRPALSHYLGLLSPVAEISFSDMILWKMPSALLLPDDALSKSDLMVMMLWPFPAASTGSTNIWR